MLFFILIGCQLQEPAKNHGILFLENRSKKLIIQKSNQNDVLNVMGMPHSKSLDSENTWIYLERTLGKGKYHKLGRHVLKTNNYGYYEYYFVHNWDSVLGGYDINISKNAKSIGDVTYELIQDPSYKSDKQVKDEYWMKEKDDRELINTVINAWEYYEGNKKEVNYWMKNIFHWYYTNSITEEEVIDSIQYLADNKILKFN